MSKPSTICYDDRRRAALRADARLNGIDYIEFDDVEVEDEERPRRGAKKAVKSKGIKKIVRALKVYFLRGLPPKDQPQLFDKANVVIEGGWGNHRMSAIRVIFEHAPDPARDDIAIIELDGEGDHSIYTLRLVGANNTALPGIDPRYSSAEFSFVPDTPAEIDCVQPDWCPSELVPAPELNYLAKDYSSFRQLLLDRLAATLPGWRERYTPDLYLTLAEALAYTADYLSYAQDAVATEAYLDTARLRISVRRHARLADYAMHEGCNARAWVCFEVESDPELPADALALITRPDGAQFDGPVLLPDMLRKLPRASYEVFEPLIEPGRDHLTERDIERPRDLARRLRAERGLAAKSNPVVAYIQSRLSDETRTLLDLAEKPDESLPRLIAALAAELDRLIADPGLALFEPGAAAQAVERYGSPNALRGACLWHHNRRKIEEIFPQEIARPARLRFHQAHNELRFYTWKQAECCLPRGATSATLRDAWLDDRRVRRALRGLRPGDVLVFEERIGPRSGNPADADPAHRHAVRLTHAEPIIDTLCDVPVVEIAWEQADALPFALCLSAVGPAPECVLLEDITVARGNVVLADHGETVRAPDPARLRDGVRTIVAVPFEPPFDVVPAEELATQCVGEGRLAETFVQTGRYEPVLANEPLVFSQPLPQPPLPASQSLLQDVRRAQPQVALFSPIERPHPRRDLVERLPDQAMARPGHMLYERWLPQPDLLASDTDDRHFAVEVDDAGAAHLRFGDGQLGVRPEADTRFLASYRVGGGLAGNVGAEAIGYALLRGEIRGGAILRIRNPLPAQGGAAAESVAQVRLRAPHAFRSVLKRAITTDDYAAIVLRDFGDRVQRAAAGIKPVPLTGRPQMTVLIDPLGAEADTASLCDSIAQHLEQFRRIGHDLKVVPAKYVPIELTITAHLLPHAQRGAVRAALLDRFSNRMLPGGSRGFFHPDALTFGQGIAVSTIVAAAQGIPGVAYTTVTKLLHWKATQDTKLWREKDTQDVPSNGLLELHADEIAQLDNDPNFPGRGVLSIELEGGI